MNEEELENDYEEVETSEVSSEEDQLNELAGIFGDEPEDTPEPQPEPVKTEQALPDDYKVKVKINGQEQEVPLSELRNGYQRQADYTAKTQELSQQRNEVEAAKQQYNQYVQSIPMLALVAEQNVKTAADQLYSQEMVDLATNDPAEYVAQKALLEKHIAENQKAYQQMSQQYAEYQNQNTQQHQQLLSETLARANELLNEQVEGWADGSTRQKLRDYALTTAELDDQDLNNLYDHRYVKILNKARLYDELVANQASVQKRVERAPPKVVSPGNGDSVDDMATLKKRAIKKANNGDNSDLLDLLASMM